MSLKRFCGGLVFAALFSAGCREEPTIVITFAPQDGSVKGGLADLSRPSDLARAPDLAGVGVAPAATANDRDPCTKDADCALAKADCCGCEAGGKARAIGHARLTAWAKDLATHCATTMCAEMISHDASCSKAAVCADGRCALGQKMSRKKAGAK